MNNYVKDYTTSYQTTGVEGTIASVYKNMFGWMAAALCLSALSAYVVLDRIYASEAFAQAFFSSPAMWIMAIGSFAMVMVLSGALHKMSMTTASLIFALYSVLMGAWIAPVLLIYTAQSVTQVFLITAGTFAGMAVYGHITSRDLSKLGSILMMALIGVIIASLVNIFMHSTGMAYIISYVAVLIFCGLTMYDVQRFKNIIYSYGQADDQIRKVALIGALNLYMDFLNLFLYLLRILGSRRD